MRPPFRDPLSRRPPPPRQPLQQAPVWLPRLETNGFPFGVWRSLLLSWRLACQIFAINLVSPFLICVFVCWCILFGCLKSSFVYLRVDLFVRLYGPCCCYGNVFDMVVLPFDFDIACSVAVWSHFDCAVFYRSCLFSLSFRISSILG